MTGFLLTMWVCSVVETLTCGPVSDGPHESIRTCLLVADTAIEDMRLIPTYVHCDRVGEDGKPVKPQRVE
jgi:hypothetical protein